MLSFNTVCFANYIKPKNYYQTLSILIYFYYLQIKLIVVNQLIIMGLIQTFITNSSYSVSLFFKFIFYFDFQLTKLFSIVKILRYLKHFV